MTVVAQQWVSLDGYAAGPGGEGDVFAAVPPAAETASQAWNVTLLDSVDEVLLGRRTYEAFVGFWPGSDEPVAPRVNAVPKVVCSSGLDAAPWGEHAPAQVVRDSVAHVRSRRDRTVLVWGSLSVQQALLEAGELDELDLFVAPVVLGAGRPLLPPGRAVALRQLSAEVWDGAVHVRYAVAATT